MSQFKNSAFCSFSFIVILFSSFSAKADCLKAYLNKANQSIFSKPYEKMARLIEASQNPIEVNFPTEPIERFRVKLEKKKTSLTKDKIKTTIRSLNQNDIFCKPELFTYSRVLNSFENLQQVEELFSLINRNEIQNWQSYESFFKNLKFSAAFQASLAEKTALKAVKLATYSDLKAFLLKYDSLWSENFYFEIRKEAIQNKVVKDPKQYLDLFFPIKITSQDYAVYSFLLVDFILNSAEDFIALNPSIGQISQLISKIDKMIKTNSSLSGLKEISLQLREKFFSQVKTPEDLNILMTDSTRYSAEAGPDPQIEALYQKLAQRFVKENQLSLSALNYLSKHVPKDEPTTKVIETANERANYKELSRLRILLKANWTGDHKDLNWKWIKSHLFSNYRQVQQRVESDLEKIDQLETCTICTDAKPSQNFVELECHHRFCKDCFKSYFDVNTSENKFQISCMSRGCTHLLDSNDLIRLGISREDFYKWQSKMIKMILKGIQGWRDCTGRNCNLGTVLPNDHDSRFVCRGCQTENCIECRDNHPGISCAAFQKQKGNSGTENWAKNPIIKECPRCHATIEKNLGCAHMKCADCGFSGNWIQDFVKPQ